MEEVSKVKVVIGVKEMGKVETEFDVVVAIEMMKEMGQVNVVE